jgi:hypothetical protein
MQIVNQVPMLDGSLLVELMLYPEELVKFAEVGIITVLTNAVKQQEVIDGEVATDS